MSKVMAKKIPTGYIAECQCGLIVGALDYTRTERKEAGQIIGKWLHEGCKIIPQFNSSWQITINTCKCES